MPRRRDLPPEEWLRRVEHLNETFSELSEAVRRQRDHLWSEAMHAGARIVGKNGLEEMETLMARVTALENQWGEALACLGHRMGLPSMYGPDGRPRAEPRTDWGRVPKKEIAQVYAELKAAWEAGNPDRLHRALRAAYHVPDDALKGMQDTDRKALEDQIQAEAHKYARAKGTQSAFIWRRLETEYARRLNISVSTLQRLAGVRKARSKR